jgi:hypothetical protein
VRVGVCRVEADGLAVSRLGLACPTRLIRQQDAHVEIRVSHARLDFDASLRQWQSGFALS